MFERITRHHDLPIWMHPARPAAFADYKTESPPFEPFEEEREASVGVTGLAY